MAFDFPSSGLVVGQIVTGPNNAQYKWDGTKWVTVTAGMGGPYLPLTGGNLTGPTTAPTPPATDNSTNIATTAFVAPVAQAAYDSSGRNYVHNAVFAIQQRPGSPWTGNTQYTLDRWQNAINNGTISISAAVLLDADRTAIGDESARWALANVFAGTSGTNDYTAVVQKIEGVRRLGNKTVTVSFWAKAAAALRLGVSLDQSPGTGGSPSGYVSGAGQSIPITTSWARYALTFTVGSTAGMTLGANGDDYTQLAFWYSGGSGVNTRTGSVGVQSGTVDLWGVQLEVGNIATPFAKRDPKDDLALCQRFFWSGLGLTWISFAVTAGGSYGGWPIQMVVFPVTMRSTPTVTPTESPGTATYGCSLRGVNTIGFGFYPSTVASGPGNWTAFAFNASADYP